jgi:AmmeMemoRadiSam system protein A
MENIREETGARLLRVARSAIQATVLGSDDPFVEEQDWPALPRLGVFVTLRKSGKLRGCIGTFSPMADLPQTVAEMARAATNDPRFTATPIGSGELPDIRIELSILSPLEPVADPLSFELGRHGVKICHGLATGCFLPDVGASQGWDKKTFLSELCRQKMRLSPDAWRDEQAEVYVFTVRKFAE